jgi:hypothetical protein
MTEIALRQAGSAHTTTAEKKYRQIIEWAKDNGAYIYRSLKFVTTADWGVEAIIDPPEAVKLQEMFLRNLYNLALSYFNAVSAGNLGFCYHPRSMSFPDANLHMAVDHS